MTGDGLFNAPPLERWWSAEIFSGTDASRWRRCVTTTVRASLAPLVPELTALARDEDQGLEGLLCIAEMEDVVAAGVSLGRVLKPGARVVELVAIEPPLWRAALAMGGSERTRREMATRSLRWRGAGLQRLEHWRCEAPVRCVVTVGTFVG